MDVLEVVAWWPVGVCCIQASNLQRRAGWSGAGLAVCNCRMPSLAPHGRMHAHRAVEAAAALRTPAGAKTSSRGAWAALPAVLMALGGRIGAHNGVPAASHQHTVAISRRDPLGRPTRPPAVPRPDPPPLFRSASSVVPTTSPLAPRPRPVLCSSSYPASHPFAQLQVSRVGRPVGLRGAGWDVEST